MIDDLQVGDQFTMSLPALKWWNKYKLLRFVMCRILKIDNRTNKPVLQSFTVVDSSENNLIIGPKQ